MATFSVQMGAMAVAYMAWSFSQKSTGQKGFFDSDERHTGSISQSPLMTILHRTRRLFANLSVCLNPCAAGTAVQPT